MIWTAAWSAAPVRKIALPKPLVCPPGLGVQRILFKPGSKAKTPPPAAVRNVVDQLK